MNRSILYSIIICWLAISPLTAQIIYLDHFPESLYSFNKLSAEVLFMDPVYNENNEIQRYEAAGRLKVEYLPVGSEYPTQKVTSQWDINTMLWKEISRYEYVYDNQGRVIQETIHQLVFYSSFLTESSLEPVYTNLYHYSREGNVETVKIEELTNDIVSSPVVTRYLNKHEQPDSAIFKEGSNNEVKVIYKYDSKNRLIKQHLYYKEKNANDPFLHAMDIEVEYKNNRLSYTYKPTPFYGGCFFSVYYPYFYIDKDSGHPLPVTITIELDKKKRILNKELKSCDDILFNTNYMYDSEGRQHADVKFLDIVNDAPVEAISHSWDLSKLFYTVKYTDRADRIVEVSYESKSDSYLYREYDVIEIVNEEGKINSYEYVSYTKGEKVKQRSRADFTYTRKEENIFRTEKQVTHTHYEKDYTRTEIWKERIEIQDDTLLINKKISKVDPETLEEISIDWTEYDKNGNITVDEAIYYDKWSDQWEGKHSITYLYDDQGRLLEKEEFEPDNERQSWGNSIKMIYQYDRNGNTIVEEKHSLYVVREKGEAGEERFFREWMGKSYIEQEYDDQNRLIYQCYYEGGYGELGSETYWEPVRKKEWVWNGNDCEETEYKWTRVRWDDIRWIQVTKKHQ